jgi:hypothetical protein
VSLSCNLQASDGMFSSVATVTISVHDVNNNHPVFGRESYVVSVQEDTAIGKNSLYKYNLSHFLVSYTYINISYTEYNFFFPLFSIEVTTNELFIIWGEGPFS